MPIFEVRKLSDDYHSIKNFASSKFRDKKIVY
jgi:hypothetical protein